MPDGGDGEPAKSIHLNPSAKAISITKGNIPVPTSVTVTGTAVNTTIQYWYYSANGATSFTSTPPTGVTRSGNQVTINSATAKFKTLSIKAKNSTDDVEDVVTITRSGGAPYVIQLLGLGDGDESGHTEQGVLLALMEEYHTQQGITIVLSGIGESRLYSLCSVWRGSYLLKESPTDLQLILIGINNGKLFVDSLLLNLLRLGAVLLATQAMSVMLGVD